MLMLCSHSQIVTDRVQIKCSEVFIMRRMFPVVCTKEVNVLGTSLTYLFDNDFGAKTINNKIDMTSIFALHLRTLHLQCMIHKYKEKLP